MAKSLFSDSAMYIGRKSKRAMGTVIGVSSKWPDKIVLTHLSSGIVRAATIDHDEVSEIFFSDIACISISDDPEYNDGKHMQIAMKNGENHIFLFKKEAKAQAAVQALSEILVAAK